MPHRITNVVGRGCARAHRHCAQVKVQLLDEKEHKAESHKIKMKCMHFISSWIKHNIYYVALYLKYFWSWHHGKEVGKVIEMLQLLYSTNKVWKLFNIPADVSAPHPGLRSDGDRELTPVCEHREEARSVYNIHQQNWLIMKTLKIIFLKKMTAALHFTGQQIAWCVDKQVDVK